MRKSKKILTGAAAIALIAAIGIGGTVAFLTDSEKATNTFSIGDLDITLTEPKWDDETDGKDMEPGDTVEKDPTVTAVDSDSYVRIIMTVKDGTGTVITDADRLSQIISAIRYADPALSEDTSYAESDLADIPTVNPNFTLKTSENGVYTYHYNDILAEGDSAVLFTNVVIPTDWNREKLQKLGAFQIEIYAQAIQASNFASADDAFAALDAEIAAGNLSEDYGQTGKVEVTP